MFSMVIIKCRKSQNEQTGAVRQTTDRITT